MNQTPFRPMLALLLAASVVLALAPAASADVTITERALVAPDSAEKEEAKQSGNRALGLTGGGSGSLIDGSGLEYFINTDVTFTTAESASGSASDATYTTSVAASTSGGGTTMTTLSDAFDGYNGVCFADSPGLGECDPDSAQFEVYNDNGPATLGCNNCELLFANQTIGNLSVTRRAFVPDDDEFARFLTIITNNGAAPETVNFLTANNLGSDDDTEIFGTSSGDNVASPADFWIASFEAFDGSGLSYDPRLGHLLHGPGAETPVSTVSFSDGQNQPYWEYNFTVDPGETVIIMNLVTGQPNQPDVITQLNQLINLPPSVFECMTPTEIAQIINFDTGGANVLEIPTTNQVGLAALMLLLLGAGLFVLRQNIG